MTSVTQDQVHDETIPSWGTWGIAWDPEGDVPSDAGFDSNGDDAWDYPTEADEAWWAGELVAREYHNMRITDGPTDADIEEAYRICAWQDAIERGRMISDEDILIATGCVG